MFLNEDSLHDFLLEKYPHLEVELVDSIDSTNVSLRNWYNSGQETEKLLVALEQTAGVGRHKRKWLSPKETQLIFSLGIPLKLTTALRFKIGWISLITGLTLAETLWEKFRLKADLKWPNDVLIDDKKIAGILVELVNLTATDSVAIIGMGVNVYSSEWVKQLGTATSVEEWVIPGEEISVTEFTKTLISKLMDNIQAFLQGKSFYQEYMSFSNTINKLVRLELETGEIFLGKATDVDTNGFLKVVDEAGVEKIVSAGEITHLRKIYAEE